MVPMTNKMSVMVHEIISMVMEMAPVSRRLGHKCPF